MQGASRDALARLRDVLVQSVGTATDSAALQRLSEDLFAVVTLFAGQASLRRAVSDPALETDAKVGLVDRLLSGKVGDPALGLVRQAARSRWSQPRDVVDAIEAVAVEAALSQAEHDDQLDEVEDQIFRFERIISAEPDLRTALTDRNLPLDRKRQLLQRLLDGKVSTVTLALVERAVLSPRGRTLERVLDEFLRLAAQRRSRVVARVTTAVPLTDDQQTRLAAALGREFGGDVRLQVVVDPSLLGGLTVRVGDELLDASVARQLDTAHRKLTGRF
ncbi:MAG: F-type H+-transporting ATPase subunit delta [Frankiaceae bacterium]|jgi:F-type H+-transporting ATPase subunit delta|nr:F-type H+-transporting ATPase subunit delta [Frankiaceae bacterium]